MGSRGRVDTALKAAVSIVAQKDSGRFRQQVFSELAGRRLTIRCICGLHRILGTGVLSTLLVSLYGVHSYLSVPRQSGTVPIVGVYAYRNEHRQFEYVRRCLRGLALGLFKLSKWRPFNPLHGLVFLWSLRHWGLVRRSYRLIASHNAEGDFLVACRVASTVGFYLRFKTLLKECEPKAVLVSSDSNPYAMGLVYAARQAGLKTIYINHGHIPDQPPVLDFDLSILDGEALLDVYRAVGEVRGDVVFKGVEGIYRELDLGKLETSRPTVGIFTSLVMDWDRFRDLVESVRERLNPSQILIRFHPNRVIREWAAVRWAVRQPDVRVSMGEKVLLQDAKLCDVVLAGNSSCHLSLLRYGVPTFYVAGLDQVPHDFYRFLELGIVPAFDKVEAVDLPKLATFYGDPQWSERFTFFDAGYPGKDLSVRVGDAVLGVVDV